MRAEMCSSFAAALLLGVAASLASYADPVRAHGSATHAGAADVAPSNARRNRWGADYFPNVPLVTQDGETVHFYDDLLKDKIVAINVIYTSCDDECPIETARLVELQRILGERVGTDIFFYSISIDPEHDTPQVLKTYAERFGVGPGWQFLTGKPEDVALVVKKLGLSRASDAQNRDGHTASLMVGNVPGGLWMRNSAVDNPQFLASRIGTFLSKWKGVVPQKSYADARPLNLGKGQYLFQARCSACHTIGGGAHLGPDLLGVTTRRDRHWLARYIQMPDAVRAEGDAIAEELGTQFGGVLMPNLNLGAVDVAAVISYLDSRTRLAEKRDAGASVSAR